MKKIIVYSNLRKNLDSFEKQLKRENEFGLNDLLDNEAFLREKFSSDVIDGQLDRARESVIDYDLVKESSPGDAFLKAEDVDVFLMHYALKLPQEQIAYQYSYAPILSSC